MWLFSPFLQTKKNSYSTNFQCGLYPEMREGPHVRLMRLRILLSRSCGFTLNQTLKAEFEIITYFCSAYIHNINADSHGTGCCSKIIMGARNGQGDIMTRIVTILGHPAFVLMFPWLSGIGSDVVMTPGNFQAYSEL